MNVEEKERLIKKDMKSIENRVRGAFNQGYDMGLKAHKEQRTGRWKRISIDKYSEHAQYWYRCDKCGMYNLGNTDFCPNCGAKMEE